jgi:hypothetical protein
VVVTIERLQDYKVPSSVFEHCAVGTLYLSNDPEYLTANVGPVISAFEPRGCASEYLRNSARHQGSQGSAFENAGHEMPNEEFLPS